jgi:hypothetical protein
MTEHNDQPLTPRVWVCDGCMGRVRAHEIADFADGEHVLCRACVERERGPR